MEWIRGEVIGRGSFGTINLATLTKTTNTNDNNYSTSIVVKSSSVTNSSSLENEKEILTKLGNGHRNIIQYFGDCISQEKGSQFYNLFLEYASKGSLADHLGRFEGKKLGKFEVKKYTNDLLNGLCYVHEKGFVHCDVKLQNMLVFEGDLVKLADFGLSRKVTENGLSGCQLRGTPLYMAPEVVAGGKLETAAADIWAVGCAVVEMVTGNTAWVLPSGNDVNGLFYRIGVLGECPEIPEELCDDGKDFLRKCFIKDPNERWTARMLLDHPFLSGVDCGEEVKKSSVSPKCPFEFPNWESSDESSFGSCSSIESFDSTYFNEEIEFSCFRSISGRFEAELVGNSISDWSDLDGWITIR